MAQRTAPQEALPLPLPSPDAAPAVEFAEPGTGPPRYTTMPTPIGEILLTSDGHSLTGLFMMPEAGWGNAIGADWRRDPAGLRTIEEQLRAYFAGELREFSVPLAPSGTPFQRRVWQALTTVPYGGTASYGTIAAAIERPSASRAVGAANGRNPISIVVPCHRVVGADGSLTGYGGGLPRKQRLLALEKAHAA